MTLRGGSLERLLPPSWKNNKSVFFATPFLPLKIVITAGPFFRWGHRLFPFKFERKSSLEIWTDRHFQVPQYSTYVVSYLCEIFTVVLLYSTAIVPFNQVIHETPKDHDTKLQYSTNHVCSFHWTICRSIVFFVGFEFSCSFHHGDSGFGYDALQWGCHQTWPCSIQKWEILLGKLSTHTTPFWTWAELRRKMRKSRVSWLRV